MKRIAVLGTAVLLLIFTLAGCAPELHERLLIRAIGIDSIGAEKRVTVRVSDAASGGKEISFTAGGNTVAEALEEISRNTGKDPLYSHNALIVFGRTCAADGLRDSLDFFLRHYDSRPNVKVLLADRTAEEILRIEKSDQSPVASEDIAALLKAEAFSGSTADADLITLINGTYGADQSAVLPIMQKGESIELAGAGILTDMRLCAELDSDAMRGYLILTEKLTAGETSFENKSCGKVAISAVGSCCSIAFTGTKENPRFSVKAEIEGEISSISSGKAKLKSEVLTELEKQYATKIQENIEAYLHTAVFDSGSDAAGIGRAVQRYDPSILYAVSENFPEFLKNANIDIQVTAQIDRVEEEDTPYL